jgi:hypothetical protein
MAGSTATREFDVRGLGAPDGYPGFTGETTFHDLCLTITSQDVIAQFDDVDQTAAPTVWIGRFVSG